MRGIKVLVVGWLVIWTLSALYSVVNAQPPKVADPGTKFHRGYVLGNGNNASEDEAFEDDLNELKGDLETGRNQAAGSTSETLRKPTKDELRRFINGLKDKAKPGEEVTFYFSGHGNVDRIRLSADVVVTARELAEMLRGFQRSVTLVVILDSCFGGSFSDDIGESDHVAVIGPSTTCPIDPPGIFGGFTETFTEEIADAAGEREADKNDDGKVTADELKQRLKDVGWKLGQPQPGDKPKQGKSKCLQCQLPTLSAPSSGQQGSVINLGGRNFASSSVVTINLIMPDLTQLRIGSSRTDQQGFYATSLTVPNLPDGQYLLHAIDGEANEDWVLFNVGRSVPATTEWGLLALGLLLAGSLAFMIRRRFTVRPVGV